MIASLVPRLDFAPVPRMQIRLGDDIVEEPGEGDVFPLDDVFTDVFPGEPSDLVTVTIPDGTDEVTVWRVVDGIAYKVQGVVERAFSGSLGALDHAAPPNALSTYELECFADGEEAGRVSLGSSFSGSLLGPSEVIIQNPLNPNLHAVVRNMAGSWPDITRNAPGASVFTEGDDLPTFVGFGPLRGIQGLAVDFEVPDRETAARVWATLGTQQKPQLPIWLIRSPNPGLMPKVFYGRVTGIQELDVTVGRSKGVGGKSRFRATLQQVKQPNPALIVPSLTYADLAAALGGTYSGIAAALPKYSDWATAWEYSGAAG